MTKVVSGIAAMLASAPCQLLAVEMIDGDRRQGCLDDDARQQQRAERSASFAIHPSSWGLKKARIPGCSWMATIAVTAVKLSWKLGPASASGRKLEHGQRRCRDEAQRDRLAAERDADEDDDRCEQRAHCVGTCAPLSSA